MKNKFLKVFLLFVTITLSSCETLDLDQLNNPSTLPAEKSDPIYVFNYAQITLPDFVDSANSFTQRVTRQMAMTGGNNYNNAFSAVSFNNNWTTGYLILNAIKSMEPKAIASGQNYILGASKIIRCYVLMTMVDMYGDIPYSEALQGNANLTPKYDHSADVYASIYNELNDAIVLMSSSAEADELLPRDLYYGSETSNGGGKTKWITLAKTLKFKMLLNARNVGTIGSLDVRTEISNLLTENDLINASSQDFAFKYGTERDLPNSRHPLYNDQYEFGGGAYIANYFFWTVSVEKGKSQWFDPREKFYFFKQAALSTSVNVNAQTVPCKYVTKPDYYDNFEYASFYSPSIKASYCYSNPASMGTSYLGRDHGDNSGIPQDDTFRSVVGTYPAGGAIGDAINVNSATNAGLKGALGKGIMPMVLTSYVHFMKAEAILMLALPGNARFELESGIRESITKTINLVTPPNLEFQGYVDDAITATPAYLTLVLDKYDAVSTDKKLELIEKEYYIAAWGNGIEPYNAYRRTGYPSNFQPTVNDDNPGAFFNTALYPLLSQNNNPNTPSNVRTKKVFWDVAPVVLH